MVFKKVGQNFVVRLVVGEKLIETLATFAKEQGIESGWVSGLGGAQQVELGTYHFKTKEFTWRAFDGDFEIDALQGNIAVVDGESYVHLHGSFNDDTFKAFGGHVKEATMAGTGEFLIQPFEGKITRTMNDEVGLKLLDL